MTGRIIFFEEGGGSQDFMCRGGTFFSEAKRGSRFFQSLILIFFLKKRNAISEIRVQAVLLSHCLSFKYGLANILFNT